jgi:actin-related protein
MPNLIGVPKHPSTFTWREPESFIGEEAIQKASVMHITCPMQRGIVTNWEDMEQIWYTMICRRLRLVPGEHPIVSF